jgi:hypothetical protein
LCEPCDDSATETANFFLLWGIVLVVLLLLFLIIMIAFIRYRKAAGNNRVEALGTTAATLSKQHSWRTAKAKLVAIKAFKDSSIITRSSIGALYDFVMRRLEQAEDKLKVLIAFFQVLTTFTEVIDIPWPRHFVALLEPLQALTSLDLVTGE